jgi:hypothetical protein
MRDTCPDMVVSPAATGLAASLVIENRPLGDARRFSAAWRDGKAGNQTHAESKAHRCGSENVWLAGLYLKWSGLIDRCAT